MSNCENYDLSNIPTIGDVCPYDNKFPNGIDGKQVRLENLVDKLIALTGAHITTSKFDGVPCVKFGFRFIENGHVLNEPCFCWTQSKRLVYDFKHIQETGQKFPIQARILKYGNAYMFSRN